MGEGWAGVGWNGVALGSVQAELEKTDDSEEEETMWLCGCLHDNLLYIPFAAPRPLLIKTTVQLNMFTAEARS